VDIDTRSSPFSMVLPLDGYSYPMQCKPAIKENNQ
jgi:hypothetical protein